MSMENIKQILDFIKNTPVDFIFVIVATCGGYARYLNGYTNGVPFRFSIFMASGLAAGFSGYMFATLGQTMALPESMLFVMAGTGGFFGEQTMKYILERVTKKDK